MVGFIQISKYTHKCCPTDWKSEIWNQHYIFQIYFTTRNGPQYKITFEKQAFYAANGFVSKMFHFSEVLWVLNAEPR